jgi:RNA polymerase sigma-70 factor (ECF subfamily)
MAIQRELVQRAQQGDLDAFSALTVGRTNRLYQAARLILRDSSLAEDVVQDSLVRAWQDIRGLRDPDKFDAWLHRLLVRDCYRAAARNRKRTRIEVDIVDVSRAEPGSLAGEVETRDQIARGFERLSPDQRTVVVLHHYLGFSLAESAEVLGIPLGTMQSRLFRALRRMRAALDADDKSPVTGRRPG